MPVVMASETASGPLPAANLLPRMREIRSRSARRPFLISLSSSSSSPSSSSPSSASASSSSSDELRPLAFLDFSLSSSSSSLPSELSSPLARLDFRGLFLSSSSSESSFLSSLSFSSSSARRAFAFLDFSFSSSSSSDTFEAKPNKCAKPRIFFVFTDIVILQPIVINRGMPHPVRTPDRPVPVAHRRRPGNRRLRYHGRFFLLSRDCGRRYSRTGDPSHQCLTEWLCAPCRLMAHTDWTQLCGRRRL